jgi:hypothetical protein
MSPSHIATTRSTIADKAELIISSRLTPIAGGTKYLAGFQTRNGRHIAVERGKRYINLWTENVPRASSGDTAEVYPRLRTRHSNLPSQAPRLKVGHEAICWRVPDLASVDALIRWYEAA